jgi:Na+-transporting NADH:ubiquinone oxidoreductase subunit C
MVERQPDDSALRALATVLGVAVICALLVSMTAVTLRPYYNIAKFEAERRAALESIVGALSGAMGVVTPDDVETWVVELDSGRYSKTVDPVTYDARQATTDPDHSVSIPPEMDLARIKRRANHAVVYIVRGEDKKAQAVILPVHGSGYQSTLYGFLALAIDTNTVLALKFYEQAETPGIGDRILDSDWEALWPGKRVFDETGTVRIGVDRGKVAPGSADADYLVDGISGATRTSLGVNRIMRFWLSDLGFGPFLERMHRGES